MLVGITGAPGAGKSTLASQIASAVRRQGQTIGIIAVDPSSPFSRGALLGDRIRMQEHHGDPGVFIRSMATRGKLGGLARSTLEIALLFDAFGVDVVLIETVGVGQDEIDIARLADVTVLVLAPGFGDDVQAMKAGIMEVADLFAINKSDLPGADQLEQDIRAMQSISNSIEPLSQPAPIRRVVATNGSGVDGLLAEIRSIHATAKQKGSGTKTWMINSWVIRLREMLRESLLECLPENEVERHAMLVANKQEDPYSAVTALRQLLA
jgi:LAO/AO transport system kinase